MTAPLFAWRPDATQTANTQPRLRTVPFGDGYAEKSPVGLNHLPKQFQVQFNQRVGTGAPTPDYLWDKDDILAFLAERGGYKPFYFALTDSPKIALVTCEQWQEGRNDGGAWQITATFDEVFTEANVYQPIFDLYGDTFTMHAALQALENTVNGPAGATA